MTDAELEAFCQLNDVKRVERTREGVIEMNPPTGSYTSASNSEITGQLRAWWKTHRRGQVYDSNGGFYLADGSMLSPDASYLTAERLAGVTKEDRRGFPHVCPNFVIELFSKTDRMAKLKQKMERWIENGAQLGWLIDPYRREVHVYTLGGSRLSGQSGVVEGEGPVVGFALDLLEVWSCYEG
jgi:Uma2 family endonuclease